MAWMHVHALKARFHPQKTATFSNTKWWCPTYYILLYMNAPSTSHKVSPSWRRGLFSMHQQCPRFEWLRGLKSSGGAPLRVVHIAVAPSQRRSWSKRSGTLGSKLQIKNQVLQIKLYEFIYRYIDGRNYRQPEIRATFIQTLHFWMEIKVRTGRGCSYREVKMENH